jgi:hypothetical protein
MVKRWTLILSMAAVILGGVAVHTMPAQAETATIQPSYPGDCHRPPAASLCIEFDDGYRWLVEDTIVAWGRNHGPIQMAYGLKANYAHELHTEKIWLLPPIGT